MQTIECQDVAGIAAGLSEATIHVWRLRYERVQRRGPLRALLALYLGAPAESIIFVENEHGRPELATPWRGQLQFNWSHSGDAALVTIARRLAPGVDIERVRARPRAMHVAERFFHSHETAALAALEPSRRDQAFLQLWTGKEAVLKAMGRGIAFGLDRLCLAVAPAAPRVLWLDGDDATQWQLHALSLDADHLASVAWRGPALSVAAWTLADST
ncbi:4-phosphopantetheinyl transferase [Dyella monticola]|uniref:4-phosphopantetheinyl transferase n=1 Tax=Dyella monticola TaxID=1927958 RepID=A0A370X065_9GAMM|nr:4'-phosphopantetheinyl transferase superfamily protein [Dyella monticola]RDS81746.1 4-phosphopantetheinyl transferase [Dyella monticola]